jgi:hypothetical protein
MKPQLPQRSRKPNPTPATGPSQAKKGRWDKEEEVGAPRRQQPQGPNQISKRKEQSHKAKPKKEQRSPQHQVSSVAA